MIHVLINFKNHNRYGLFFQTSNVQKYIKLKENNFFCFSVYKNFEIVFIFSRIVSDLIYNFHYGDNIFNLTLHCTNLIWSINSAKGGKTQYDCWKPLRITKNIFIFFRTPTPPPTTLVFQRIHVIHVSYAFFSRHFIQLFRTGTGLYRTPKLSREHKRLVKIVGHQSSMCEIRAICRVEFFFYVDELLMNLMTSGLHPLVATKKSLNENTCNFYIFTQHFSLWKISIIMCLKKYV